jgi:hypothetical protein
MNLRDYVLLAKHAKRKRVRIKAWNKAVKLAGVDREGLINYAKIARCLDESKN